MGKWTVNGHPLSGAALQMERDVHRADVASPGDEPSAAIRAGQHRHGGMRWQGSRAVQRLLCGGCGCRGALRRGQSSRHHCRNTGRGRGGFSRSAVRHAKKTARPTCFTALPPFCRKTKFVPCTNDSFRMGTHTFIIPLLSRFVNVTSGLFRAESEKIHFCGRKTHNLNIFGVFVRLHLRGRCDRIRENRGKCFPVNFRKE